MALTPSTSSYLQGKGRSLCLASLWKITRRDGEILRFTDHNSPITFEGNTFTPFNGIDASARQRNVDTEHSNLDVIGIISDTTVTDEELAGGLWRGARIEEVTLNWKFPFLPAARRDTFIVTEIKRVAGESWSAKLEGLTRQLEPKVGNVYTRNCRHTLGDSVCGIDIAALTLAGTVTAVETTEALRVFQATGTFEGPYATDETYWDWGNLEWKTGSNDLSANLSFMEVKRSRRPVPLADIRVELQLDMPYAIEVGDTFEIIPGCNKTKEHCKTKFTNYEKFGGFPFIPGADKMLQSPKA